MIRKLFFIGSLAAFFASSAFVKPAGADAEASKLNSFPILQPTGPEASKLNSFPILQPAGPEASKHISYVILDGRPSRPAIFGAPF